MKQQNLKKSLVILSNQDAKRLYDDLMSNYSNLVRPVKNLSEPVTVRIKLKLSQLIEVNLKDQIMTTSMWVEQYWHDGLLTWNPDDYGGIKMMHVPSDQIWRPDIVLYNNAAGDFEVTLSTKAQLSHKGDIKWNPPAMFKSYCEIDVEYFPFDEQTCLMKFGSWTNDGWILDLRHVDEIPGQSDVEFGIDLSDFYLSVEWDLIEVPARRHTKYYLCCESPYLDLTFNISMRRKTLFYTVNLIIPCMGISFLTVLVFYLPSDSGEKISLSVSILVALTVFFLLLAETIPPTSLVVPFLGKYLLFTMLLVGLSICVTVLVLNVHFRSGSTHHMSNRMRKLFLEILPKYLFMERPNYQYSNNSLYFNGYTNNLKNYFSLELEKDFNKIFQRRKRKRRTFKNLNEPNLKKMNNVNRNIKDKFNKDENSIKQNENTLINVDFECSTCDFKNLKTTTKPYNFDNDQSLTNSIKSFQNQIKSPFKNKCLKCLKLNRDQIVPSNYNFVNNFNNQSDSIDNFNEINLKNEYELRPMHSSKNNLNCQNYKTINDKNFNHFNHFEMQNKNEYKSEIENEYKNENEYFLEYNSDIENKYESDYKNIENQSILENDSNNEINDFNNEFENNFHNNENSDNESNLNSDMNDSNNNNFSEINSSNIIKSNEFLNKSFNQQVKRQFSDSVIKSDDYNLKMKSAMSIDQFINYKSCSFSEKCNTCNKVIDNKFSSIDNLPFNKQRNSKIEKDQNIFIKTFYTLEKNPYILRSMKNAYFLAEHNRKCILEEEIKQDWKYVAMVLDRLFLWIFLLAVLFGTFSIILLDKRHPADQKISQLAFSVLNKTRFTQSFWHE
uniref:Nicotinic acetylcholine receptor n=1 Tax=Polyphagotarsonemus latus TaxID=1204166 RepID=A0AAN0N5Z2_9ACAR